MFGYSLIKTDEIKAYRQFFIDMRRFQQTEEHNWDKIKELNKLYDEGKISAKEYNEQSSKILLDDLEKPKMDMGLHNYGEHVFLWVYQIWDRLKHFQLTESRWTQVTEGISKEKV